MALNFTFKSPGYLHFKGGKPAYAGHKESKIEIVVEQSYRNNYNMMVFRDKDNLSKKNEPFNIAEEIIDTIRKKNLDKQDNATVVVLEYRS